MGISAFARPEFIADISLNTTNNPFQLPTNGGNIPNDRFMYGLRLQFEGRMANPATGGPTGTQADAPYSLIENVKVEGYHRFRGQRETFINLRGAELRELGKIYNARAPYVTPSSLSTTASANNDIRFILDVPFVPLNLPIRQQMMWLLDAPNYEGLQLTVQYADDKSVFTGQTTAPTFSAFGSAGGNPKLRVSGHFTLGGASRFANFVPGRLWRYHQEVTSGDITGGANNSRLFNLVRGYRLRHLLLKTGVKSAAVTAGNNVYNSLSNTILTNIKVFQGLNKPIRYWTDMLALQEDAGVSYGASTDTGYALIDFANHGLLAESLKTANLIAGPTGDTDLFLQADISGASSQAALLVYEELRHAPQNLFRRKAA